MNRRLQWSVGLVLVALSVTASAQVPELGYKMLNNQYYPFRYYIDGRNPTPAGISLEEVRKATIAAFDTWENVGPAYPDFQYMGETTTIGNVTDAVNVSTIWVTDPGDAAYTTALASGAVTSGTVPLTYAGYLYQCDIFINAVDFRWTTLPNTDPAEKFRDLQTALIHEIGHCLGFPDVYVPMESVMNPQFPVGGSRRVLAPEDVQMLVQFYPDQGKAVGSPCSPSSPSCAAGLACIPFKDGSGTTLYNYCSKPCTNSTTGECPSPYACRPTNAIPGYANACLAVPGDFVTQVGKACTDAAACGSGRAVCQRPQGLPSGTTIWVDGYCQEACTVGSSASVCPAGSLCANTDPQGPNDRCLKKCRPGTADCREGYTCSPLAEGNVCVPNCYVAQDCGAGFTCRVCDRICIQNKPAGLSIGDPCARSDQCGPGQVCLFINNNSPGICTQPCSTAACGCPTGTTCKDVGPDRVCMKDCVDGTCTAPLQCNPLGETSSCMPGCRSSQECPTGYECSAGKCRDPSQVPDAGCTLCSDGGTPPPPPPPTDGGPGGGGGSPDGCGCSGAPASALVFFAALALVLLGGGRRSWHRR